MKVLILSLALLPFSAFASNKVEIRTLCMAAADKGKAEATHLELEVIHRTGGDHRRHEISLSGRIAGLGQITAGTAELSEAEFAELKDAPSPVLNAGLTLFNGQGYDSINRYRGSLVVGGSLSRPEALTIAMDRIGVEGEHPVNGPSRLVYSINECE